MAQVEANDPAGRRLCVASMVRSPESEAVGIFMQDVYRRWGSCFWRTWVRCIRGRRPCVGKQDDGLNQSLDERNSEVAQIMATAAANRQYGQDVDSGDEYGDGEDPEISMINK